MKVTVKAPGSCGELAQGTIDGKNFLITCPIDLYSTVTVTPSTTSHARKRPFIGSKVRTAMEKTLQYLNITNRHFEIAVASELPIGKGMASSSADISATCQSIALSVGKRLTPDEIADIALAIEPTDGIFYPGVMLFDHVHGRIRQPLGEALSIYIAVFDVGGEINTVQFNERPDLKTLNQTNEEQVRQAMELITTGLTRRDSALIGKGATLSALANQNILYKPHLEEIIEISQRHGAVGVNIAHSGTVLGVLFPGNYLKNISACRLEMNHYCHGVAYLRTVQLISGGLIEEWERR